MARGTGYVQSWFENVEVLAITGRRYETGLIAATTLCHEHQWEDVVWNTR